ncbi:uncharacterized protein N7498_002089 [Penicillium cinerascens]|uniref:Uncharacterized protein n=1 Tax=Penicillium cinerascens TaxID=70096 RepID=A0A9W9N9D9_9EURO|nr:uncharacterized protein N7498_002089 [Penicillium cinerascens]KAJ5215682.1 hypothetical protein N7498_002089 [Penicillium cinerascens]
MDYFRRLHLSSYPPRPSPLGSSQESREDRPRSYGVPAHDPRRDDKPRPTGRYDYSSPTPTSSQNYSPAARSSHPQRGQNGGIQLSPPRNQSAHQHRRHASVESKSQPQTHRRNHSQPQSGHHRPAHVAETSMDGGYHSTWHGGQAAKHQASLRVTLALAWSSLP